MANQEEIWLYIDGQLTASEPTLPIHANKEPVALGNNMAMQAPFSGSIYDPRFFNAELTGAEITTLAQFASDVLVSDSGLSGGCD